MSQWRIFRRDDTGREDFELAPWQELAPFEPPEPAYTGYIYKPTAAEAIGQRHGAGRYLVLSDASYAEIEIRAEPRFVLVKEEEIEDVPVPA